MRISEEVPHPGLQLRVSRRSGINSTSCDSKEGVHSRQVGSPLWCLRRESLTRHLIVSSESFSSPRLQDSPVFYCRSEVSNHRHRSFWIKWIKVASYQHVPLYSFKKKKLTGLLIQRMSALSDRDSSGPKSVTGWASTLELCFRLSMLKLALGSKFKTTV